MRTQRMKSIVASAAVAATAIALLGAAGVASGQEVRGVALGPSLDEAARIPSLLSDAPGDDNGWKFRIGFPLWVPGIDGDVTVRDQTLTADQSTEDVADVLDKSLEFAFAGHLRRRTSTRSPWTFSVGCE